jgi:hypothetical protein
VAKVPPDCWITTPAELVRWLERSGFFPRPDATRTEEIPA